MEEIDLAKRSIKGDKEAFSILIKIYEKSLYRIAISIVRNNEDALDCIQEAILKVYENIYNLKKAKYFKTWIIRILINKCNDLISKNSKLVFISEYKNVSYDDSTIYNIELNDILESLEEELRIIVMLYYFEDLSIRNISKIINIPQGTVKSRLSRARKKLRVLMESDSKEVNLIWMMIRI